MYIYIYIYIYVYIYLYVHGVWSFQVHMFNSTPADISRLWSIWGILEPFAFSVCLYTFGGRDSLKKRRFTKMSCHVCPRCLIL